MSNLAQQVAIISGGLGDIGRAVALELARRGADVAVGDIHECALAAELLGKLRSFGRQARYDRVDVADSSAVKAWVLAVEKDFGLPSLIIPCAAIVTVANSQKVTPAEWRHELSINLDGVFYLAQTGALRLLSAGKPGRIVFIGSWAGRAPHPEIITYCVSKAGIRIMCKCMALEYARFGILVNEVDPGYVDGGLARHWYEQDPTAREKDARLVPIGKLIEPEEVALQVAHLCAPENRHMTGSVLCMDGGLSLVSTAYTSEVS